MSVLSELRADLASGKVLRAVAVGWLMGAVIVIHCIALAPIVFSGALLPFAVQGTGMMLFGGIAFCLVIGASSSYRGILAVPQEVPATVLGTLGAAVAAATVDAPREVTFMTMAALLVLSGLLTGLFFFAVGHLRLSNLFRFIPYPVAGGFFAGTGWVLSLAALSVMSGMTLDWHTLPRALDPDIVWKWTPGAAYAFVLALVMRRGGNIVLVMGSVVVVSALYHLGLFVLDMPVAEARAQGLLLSGMPEGGPWPAFAPGDFRHVDWGVVAAQVPGLVTVTLVTLLCLLVYLNGLEVATGVDVDLDREFRAAGVAGLCAGAGGSAPGCHAFVFTLPCRMLGADTPWTGMVVAMVLALSLFLGSGILELLPMSIIGGLLLYVAVDLLDAWLIRVRKRLHWTDYALIVLIAVTIAAFGFIAGVAVGMLATLSLFAMRLSRVDVVTEEFTGRERQSTKVRSVPDRTILFDHGARIRAFRLRGYIFFGSVHPLVDHIKQPAQTTVCIVLDFDAVPGCDFSAVHVLCQFLQSAHAGGAQVVVSAAPEQLEQDLRGNLPEEVRKALHFEADLDHGLERGEDLLIARMDTESPDPATGHGRLLDRAAAELERHLEEQIRFEELLELLAPWLEPRQYAAGESLAARGEVQHGMQLLVSGRASVHDAEGRRLYECVPGDALEPWAAFTEHIAATTAVAHSACRTMMLTMPARERLESHDNALSLRLYAFLINQRSPHALSLHAAD